MKLLRRVLIGIVAIVVVVIVGGAVWLFVAPPALLRIADGYAAKIVCSNFYLAARDPSQVLNVDVQAPGNPLLKLVQVDVDKVGHIVTARMLGWFATGVAVYREGLGCAAVPDGNIAAAQAIALAEPPAVAPRSDAAWPVGSTVDIAPDPTLQAILADPAMTGPGMRAVVVVRDGHIVGETYGPGFNSDTPLIGWSMSKTVSAILLGRVMGEGKIGFDDAGLFPEWAGDGRKDVRIRDLLSMASGLAFNEEYGDVTDVTQMLYLEPDMAGFAAKQPLVKPPGTAFSYSTGTGMMLSRLWMSRLADEATALAYPRQALFDPLGMTSAVFEADEHGTLAGGSYVYASGRDWARVGQFLLQGGVWNGQSLLPDGFVQMMSMPNGFPGGYSKLQTWLEGPSETDAKTYGLPRDTFWLEGHDGQSVAVIPSAKLVVVRLGLTPSDLGYGPEPMIKAILAAGG